MSGRDTDVKNTEDDGMDMFLWPSEFDFDNTSSSFDNNSFSMNLGAREAAFEQQLFGDVLQAPENLTASSEHNTGSVNHRFNASHVVEDGSSQEFSTLTHDFEAPHRRQHPNDGASPFDMLCNELVPQERGQRALPRRRSKYLLRRSRSRTRAIAVPIPNPTRDGASSLIMQRWQESPPEDEAAPLSAIQSALKSRTPSEANRLGSASAFNTYRTASSTTSLDSGASMSSLQSSDSSRSATSATFRGKDAPSLSNRRKRSRQVQKSAGGIFKCTFCCDSFRRKFDWARHEKSLHLNLEEWRCTPLGATVVDLDSGNTYCAYCNAPNPTTDHLKQHNYLTCQNSQLGFKTFRRKDHLVQHLRLVHHLNSPPNIESWKSTIAPVVCRCGFCNTTLNSWEERTEHLAEHFRSGKTMSDWSGDHGFDAIIAPLVTNSMAPYLIAYESLSLVPYSATNIDSIDHFKQISSQIERHGIIRSSQPPGMPNPTPEVVNSQPARRQETELPQQEIDTVLFTELLTRHLSRFARHHMSLGVVPTDEMFQRESRRVLYDGDEDGWNQTVADNSDWLKAFRQQNIREDHPGN